MNMNGSGSVIRERREGERKECVEWSEVEMNTRRGQVPEDQTEWGSSLQPVKQTSLQALSTAITEQQLFPVEEEYFTLFSYLKTVFKQRHAARTFETTIPSLIAQRTWENNKSKRVYCFVLLKGNTLP